MYKCTQEGDQSRWHTQARVNFGRNNCNKFFFIAHIQDSLQIKFEVHKYSILHLIHYTIWHHGIKT